MMAAPRAPRPTLDLRELAARYSPPSEYGTDARLILPRPGHIVKDIAALLEALKDTRAALDETRDVLDSMATCVTTWADYAYWEERAAEVLTKWTRVANDEGGEPVPDTEGTR